MTDHFDIIPLVSRSLNWVRDYLNYNQMIPNETTSNEVRMEFINRFDSLRADGQQLALEIETSGIEQMDECPHVLILLATYAFFASEMFSYNVIAGLKNVDNPRFVLKRLNVEMNAFTMFLDYQVERLQSQYQPQMNLEN